MEFLASAMDETRSLKTVDGPAVVVAGSAGEEMFSSAGLAVDWPARRLLWLSSIRTRHGGLFDDAIVVEELAGAMVVETSVVVELLPSSAMGRGVSDTSGELIVAFSRTWLILLAVSDGTMDCSVTSPIGCTVSFTTVALTADSSVPFLLPIEGDRFSGNRFRINRIVDASALIPAGVLEPSALGLNCCVTLINFVLASMACCSGCCCCKDDPVRLWMTDNLRPKPADQSSGTGSTPSSSCSPRRRHESLSRWTCLLELAPAESENGQQQKMAVNY